MAVGSRVQTFRKLALGLSPKLYRSLEQQSVQYHTAVAMAYIAFASYILLLFVDTLANKDLKKKMSPTNAKALNTMRQRLKKHNTSFELVDLITKFRENPEADDEEEEVEEPSSSEESGSEDEGEKEEVLDKRAGGVNHKVKRIVADASA